MLPFAFEWHWDLGHFVFMGLFYLALGFIGFSVVYAFLQTMGDMYLGKTAAAEDHHDDHDDEHH